MIIEGYISLINDYEDGGLVISKEYINDVIRTNDYEYSDRLDSKVNKFLGKKVRITIEDIS